MKTIISLEEYHYMNKVLNTFSRAKKTLSHTHSVCKAIGFKEVLSEDEVDRFEALSSKFARTTDIIIKQGFRLIFKLDLEEPAQTVRDAINRAEKKDLVTSASVFNAIVKARNRIAHDYVEADDLSDIYSFALDNTPHLIDTIDRITAYCEIFDKNN